MGAKAPSKASAISIKINCSISFSFFMKAGNFCRELARPIINSIKEIVKVHSLVELPKICVEEVLKIHSKTKPHKPVRNIDDAMYQRAVDCFLFMLIF